MHTIEEIHTQRESSRLGRRWPLPALGQEVIDLRPGGTHDRIGHGYVAEARRRPIVPPESMTARLIRLVDVVGAIAGLVLLSPLMVAVGLAVWCTSSGPILFRHERVGRSGERFRCLKFRTMRRDAEDRLDQVLADPAHLAQWRASRKLTNDPRLTTVGRVLRRWDLDELPQLWNVLVGEMSLVGPRPVPEDEAELYGQSLRFVLSVRPGMTGLWQVSGRNELLYRERIKLDVAYVQNRRLLVNLQILVWTAVLLAGTRGRSA